MNFEACTQAIRNKVGADSGLGASVKFDCGNDGVIHVDGDFVPNRVSNENLEADCTINLSLDDLSALLAGKLNPATGFLVGKLKVTGDMSVAMKLQRVV